ncbi:hypothetical protein ACF3NA_04655 [Alkanindiges sp. WGS2144]|uniref:hypothetical protein n=1 Tax=Alkanindiges sp. WGS2144 TaxID=3366808 RepID=UPI0037514BCF
MHFDIQKDLNKSLESEVLGEQLFATAARFSVNKTRRQKWQTLRQLETQTKNRLWQYLAETQQYARTKPFIRLEATVSGFALACLPWKISMSLLERGTLPFLATFTRLEQHGKSDELDFFSYMTTHEQAIQKFAQLEKQGKGDSSLHAVLNLLQP